MWDLIRMVALFEGHEKYYNFFCKQLMGYVVNPFVANN